jgi:hypothetical protein
VNTVQAERDLYAFRRHLKTCRFFGQAAEKCVQISAIARSTSMVTTMGKGYGVHSKRGAGSLPTDGSRN